ncbi:hypothetical protein BJX63DRAFT_415078 [Aspergillus granulosus]|uniref:Uncharacterized protein n=1 Tax=Aspergillus granulosus TaxID=176169 RepID=A0ABR4GU85_9EURO
MVRMFLVDGWYTRQPWRILPTYFPYTTLWSHDPGSWALGELRRTTEGICPRSHGLWRMP